ncbi:anoctamin-3-like [Diorhabda sublineata]|uniref:anoctamin-3-like n=1 Tax=Diorhabda sublineata TaxID=1163346 RepID=UPI0024E0BBF8|nr:anoctamin-3-like [Diorhabda sublineata]
MQKLRFKQRKNPFNWLSHTPLSYNPQFRNPLTSADRIILLNKILENIRYGPELHDKGLSNLIKSNLVADSYPLHDAPLSLKLEDINLPDDGTQVSNTYSERELLHRYWANYKMWNKEIPVDLIEGYFGSEVAFYFAWLQYFTIMLTPVAILGVFVVIVSSILVYTQYNYRVNEICESNNTYLCPDCLNPSLCVYRPINFYCAMAKWTYAFDNYLTITLAILMAFWATVFLNFWRRKTHVLKLRWGIRSEDPALDIRKEYAASTNMRKFNNVSGIVEPFVPFYKKLPKLVFVFLVCTFFIFLDIFVIFVILYVRMWTRIYVVRSDIPFFMYNKKAVVLATSCVVQITLINLFSATYKSLSEWLTKIENPRTQKDFDNSVLYKLYFLAFANNYTVVFYTAFVKGIFYSNPRHSTNVLQKDSCQPLSCIIDLTTQLFFLMLFRRPMGHSLKLIFTVINKSLRKRCFHTEFENLPQYEEEYLLERTNKYFLMSNYNELIIQYGFITFFVAGLPLTPLYALLSNILQMRQDAYKLVKNCRRPIPKVVAGIGAWDGILLGLTYLSITTNAFVLAFTSQFVEREVYKQTHNSLKGFVNYTLSEFKTKDNKEYDIIGNKKSICYYLGMRYPPGHDQEYELTGEYWTNFTWKLVFLIIFEHLVFTSNTLLSYFIKNVPTSVTEHLAYERQTKREALVKLPLDQSKYMAMSQNNPDSDIELSY